MRSLILIFPLLALAGCGSSETCGASAPCGGKTYQSCCSGSTCRYLVSDGKSFACGGANCDSARSAALQYCSGQGPPEVCKPDGQTVALAARYAVQAKLLVGVKVTAGCSGASCLVDTDANSELLLLADVTQNGTMATVTVEPCDINVPSVALRGQTMPLKLSVPADQKLLTTFKPVTASGMLDSSVTCAGFTSQPITIVLGANLADTVNDPLPGFTLGGMPAVKTCGGSPATPCLTRTTPAPTDTGCVCDQDGDGKLGATLDAMNVPGVDVDQLYLDLRTSITLAGQVFPPASGQANPGPRIKGTVTGLELDEKVLGCHLASPPGDCGGSDTNTAAVLNPAITQSVNGDSTFTAIPLAGDATCQTVKDQRATLFQ
jgi:hypothetical protein